MLGALRSAEDVVQGVFCGLYRRWDRLKDHSGALYYVRASVLNGCRSVIRRRAVRRRGVAHQPPAVSPEAGGLSGEERAEGVPARTPVPHRPRRVVVLRLYSRNFPDEI